MASLFQAMFAAASAKSLWWLGITFMVGSTLAGALGGILIKLSHLVAAQKGAVILLTPDEVRQRRRRSWAYYLVGIIIFQACLNVGLSMAALAFAAQSLLSPLIACQIVFNALIQIPVLGEVLTCRDFIGTLLIVAGCVTSGIFAPHSEQHYELPELLRNFEKKPFVIYLIVMGSLSLLILICSRLPSYGCAGVLRRVCASMLPGLCVGNANIFAKSAAGLAEEGLRDGDASALKHVSTYLICIAAAALPLLSLYFLTRALKSYSTSLVVPIYISTLIVVSTVSGGIYFGEIASMSTEASIGLACGVCLVVLGVCVQASAAGHEEDNMMRGTDVTPLDHGGPSLSFDPSSSSYVPYVPPSSSTNGAPASSPSAALFGAGLDGPLLAAAPSGSRGRPARFSF